jgi:hypothetical protein
MVKEYLMFQSCDNLVFKLSILIENPSFTYHNSQRAAGNYLHECRFGSYWLQNVRAFQNLADTPAIT